MTTSAEATGSFSVCISDMIINADTSSGPVNLILCACNGDSITGVEIIKTSTNYPICVMPDVNNDKPEVTIHDGNKKIDCFIIKRQKSKDRHIIFRYNELTKTWCLQPSPSR